MRSKATVKAATAACMPRLARGCRASTARPAAPLSLLERIRDVVLRLIMLSAVSKSSVHRGRSRASSPRAAGAAAEAAAACRQDDSLRNKAVEDCIEFLKRSSAEGDSVKASSVTEAEAATVATEGDSVKASSVTKAEAATVATAAEGDPAKASDAAGVEAIAGHSL